MRNNISTLPKQECCGCRACGDSCPHQCISFVTDKEGFYYPSIDGSACVDCGLCSRICPSLHPHLSSEYPAATYAAYALDQEKHRAGSSGGLFGIIATSVIEHGGKIWGAAFDSNLKLCHCSAANIQELGPLMKSKYIQSDTTGVYKTIKQDLHNDITTLFVGTPCQCNALKNYIGGNNENLIVVDLVCHGVPSQDMFDKSIRWFEQKHDCSVSGFKFRYKEKRNRSSHIYKIDYSVRGRKKSKIAIYYDFPHYYGFSKYITMRPSCYSCKWAKPYRCSDITIADFWGIEELRPHLDSKEGVSMVLANTNAGKLLIENIKHHLHIEDAPFDYACKNNGCLQRPTQLKESRMALFGDLQNMNFDEVVKKHLTPRRKFLFDIYYNIPSGVKKIIRAIVGNKLEL